MKNQNINEKLLILTKGLAIDELHHLNEKIIKKSTIQIILVLCVPFSLILFFGGVGLSLINFQSLLLHIIMTLILIVSVILIMRIVFEPCFERLFLYFIKKNETKEFKKLIKKSKTTLNVLELRNLLYFLKCYDFFEDFLKPLPLVETEAINLIEREISSIEKQNAHEKGCN